MPADNKVKEKVVELFKHYDKDNNGYLDQQEIKTAIKEMNEHLELLGLELTDDDIQGMINRSDKNSDGKISIEEFVNLI